MSPERFLYFQSGYFVASGFDDVDGTSSQDAIVAIFMVAAIFTPPDPISQLLMALPLLGLYEISIWVAKLGSRSRSHNEADARA